MDSQGNHNRFLDHLIATQTSKGRESKCVKAFKKDINLRFREGITMGKMVDTKNRVLVGRVRGRTYSAKWLRF